MEEEGKGNEGTGRDEMEYYGTGLPAVSRRRLAIIIEMAFFTDVDAFTFLLSMF